MVGLQNWYFKELLPVTKSEKEYNIIFRRPEGKVVSCLDVLISKKEYFRCVFHRVDRFYVLLYLYFRKGLPKIIAGSLGGFLGVSENINVGYTGAVLCGSHSDE